MASQTLSPQVREAIANALVEIVDRFGTEVLASERLGIAQSSINRAINSKTAGATILHRLLEFMKMKESDLVRKYAGKVDLSVNLELSAQVRDAAKKQEWAPTTVFQLEILHRYCPTMSTAELSKLGNTYDAVNMVPLQRYGKKKAG